MGFFLSHGIPHFENLSYKYIPKKQGKNRRDFRDLIYCHKAKIQTTYAVWTGIGAVGTVIAGIILFGESRSVIRLLCIVLIVAGIVGLRFFSDT